MADPLSIDSAIRNDGTTDGRDPRIERSRQRCQDALLSLMQSQEYAEINVATIAKTAGLSRPTFYAHFSSKDALLIGIMDDAFGAFLAGLEEGEFATPLEQSQIVNHVVATWRDRADLIKLVIRAGPSPLVYEAFRNYADRMYRLSLELGMPRTGETTREYMLDFIAGSSLSILYRWSLRDFVDPPADIVKIFVTVLSPAIAALQQPN